MTPSPAEVTTSPGEVATTPEKITTSSEEVIPSPKDTIEEGFGMPGKNTIELEKEDDKLVVQLSIDDVADDGRQKSLVVST